MGGIQWNEISLQANGGTEYMARELEKRLDPSLLEEFQIFPSRVMAELDPDKLRVLWLHDLPADPASDHLANGGYTKFHALVAVSNWQMQAYSNHYRIPFSKFVVLANAITDPAPGELTGNLTSPADGEPIKIIYHTTPHRGLEVLAPVFEELAKRHPDVQLEVFSSFGMYGEQWAPRDEQYRPLFDQLSKMERVTYHGAKPREEMLKTLVGCRIFAYPSIWPETSCLCLIEAMRAGLDCVHPNYGALFETGGGLTSMYQYDEDKSGHAARLLMMLEESVRAVRTHDDNWVSRIRWQSQYARVFYDWESRAKQWDAFLRSLLGEDRKITQAEAFFEYSV